MMMQKIYWHLQAMLKLAFYKMLYRKHLKVGRITFRERFNLTICDGMINISNGVFFNHDCSLTSNGASITIGEGSIFGEGVKIYDHNHCYKDTSRPIKDQGYTSAPVVVGRHCWICSNVVILRGVTIGDNAVVGANCVVYQDVPDNTILMNGQNLITRES